MAPLAGSALGSWGATGLRAPADAIKSGHEDVFTKLDGTWLFSERRLYVDWIDTSPISS